ncbi:hypothetical protein, partial [uncultured Acetatifactor sp.]|uniref:hypothetical protein n=1 Tax=uncultured Acetatifactor sp. TaxID=1671927 RepID=UPI0026F38E3E
VALRSRGCPAQQGLPCAAGVALRSRGCPVQQELPCFKNPGGEISSGVFVAQRRNGRGKKETVDGHAGRLVPANEGKGKFLNCGKFAVFNGLCSNCGTRYK